MSSAADYIEEVAFSNPLSKPLLQLVFVAAAESETRAVPEDDRMVAVEPGLQLLDPFRVDDAGAMDAGKPPAVEPGFHAIHRLPEQVRLLTEMKPYVVAGRLDPVDFI